MTASATHGGHNQTNHQYRVTTIRDRRRVHSNTKSVRNAWLKQFAKCPKNNVAVRKEKESEALSSWRSREREPMGRWRLCS